MIPPGVNGRSTMKAWTVGTPGPITTGPLDLVERPIPDPGPGRVLVRVSTCGVCRTDLHLAEGDLPPRRSGVTPGHEVVGVVDRLGPDCRRLVEGQRVGVAWLGGTDGTCRYCSSGQENLCSAPRFTGWDLDGGYAEYVEADEAYVYVLPDAFDDVSAAPLLCAGIIGYRALRLADLPPRGRLGIWGFGASAHLTAQIAIAQGATVHVVTRSQAAQQLALRLGAASASSGAPPERLDSGIVFAPSGSVVPAALTALDRGGTLTLAGVVLSAIPSLDYNEHLFYERTVRSVTANTRADGEELLELAARLHVVPTTTPYPLEEADRALSDLAGGRVRGAAVLTLRR
jgi:propanol-preferring alcohol dehydrogenase